MIYVSTNVYVLKIICIRNRNITVMIYILSLQKKLYHLEHDLKLLAILDERRKSEF